MQRSLAQQSGVVNFLNWVEQDPLLLDHTVGEWMSSPAETLRPEMTLEETVRRFHNGRPGYPVTDGEGRLVGYCGRMQLYDGIRALIQPKRRSRNSCCRIRPQYWKTNACLMW
ncbi:MAG: CBS domain-containing protein [Acidobacteriales bacterium]|nr:CBS domain-containing protein [Terriglobales bacterium]